MKRCTPRYLGVVLPALVAALALVGVHRFQSFRPAAITLGPETTIYFDDDPSLSTRVHEAVHRRQMREKSTLGRLWSALRYNFDYRYRLDEEAEAKAGELCLQIHKFSSELPTYTTARSRRQAEAYRTWAWERVGLEVPDRVGRHLDGGARCSELLQGVVLDLPPEARLSEDDRLKLATLRFLQSYGSSRQEVEQWRARLDLAGYAEPVPWKFVGRSLPFHLIPLARTEATPPDTAISAWEAGEALHRLTYYGAERIYAKLRQPRAPYRRPLLHAGEAERVLGIPVEEWSVGLVEEALDGELSGAQVGWLERMAAHPVHHDFRRFALAPAADVIGTRYRRAPGDDGDWLGLLLSDRESIEEAFRAQWGRAALVAARGEPAEAASVVRLLLAGTLQFVENAPFEVDAVLGLELMEEALGGLARIEERMPGAAGEEGGPLEGAEGSAPGESAESMGSATRSSEASAEPAGPIPAGQFWEAPHRRALFSHDPATLYRALPEIASDDLIPYAFRRFAYRQVVLYDICLERVTRGAKRRAHDEWKASVGRGLVRRRSDLWFVGLLRRRVSELLLRSAVRPQDVCDPEKIRLPGARIAIMTAPPAGWMLADD